jgi:hypothetical protein
MLMPKKNLVMIYEHLFKEGVMVARKDFHAPKHGELDVPNLQVIKTLTVRKIEEKQASERVQKGPHDQFWVLHVELPVTLKRRWTWRRWWPAKWKRLERRVDFSDFAAAVSDGNVIVEGREQSESGLF